MITENVTALKINKLSKEQFERELEAGRLNSNEMYLVPDEPTGWIDAAINKEFSKEENDWVQYMWFGKTVFYEFRICMNDRAAETWSDYTIGTGLPAPADGESAWSSAVDYITHNAYTHYVNGGNLILQSGVEAFTDGHYVCGGGSYIAQD